MCQGSTPVCKYTQRPEVNLGPSQVPSMVFIVVAVVVLSHGLSLSHWSVTHLVGSNGGPELQGPICLFLPNISDYKCAPHPAFLNTGSGDQTQALMILRQALH